MKHKILTVTENNRVFFENLVPEEFFAPLERQGHFVLGAVAEDEEGSYAAGVLVLDVVWEEADFEGCIRWIYVPEESRNRGAGNALLEESFRLLAYAGIESVFCDLPAEPAYYGLMAFLEDWGFTFSWRDRYEVRVSMERLARISQLRKVSLSKAIPLKRVSGEMMEKCLENIQDTEAPVPDLEDRVRYCDRDVSCIIPGKDGADGLAVVCPVAKGVIEIAFLRIFSGDAKDMLNLCSHVFMKAFDKYGKDTEVRFFCRTGFAVNFMERILPDIQPLSVYHGVCPTMEEAEIEDAR